MKYIFAVLLLSAVEIASLSGQTIKGRIASSGEPVQYATVYIREQRQGTTANTKGDYEIKLDAGEYTVTYQSMGYQPVEVRISLARGQTVIKDIDLPLQYYQIPEVRITGTGEDPAYIIMRKVIGMAPYYQNNVNYYKAEVYLKGNLVVKRIPKLLQRSLKAQERKDGKSAETSIREGDVYFMESYNNIEFTAPDKYYQKVLSINSTFPEEGNEISPMSFIQASFYQPEIAEMAISPLSPAAFSHYKFRYLGSSEQGSYTINKIQVIPKRKSQQLFEGTIFIIEDLWCLQSVDLVNENLAGRIRVEQLFIPVQDDIWMPVSHKFEVNISIMGVKADAGYGSSVKYLEVRPNTALKRPETVTTNYTGRKEMPKADTAQSKSLKQISRILEKDELSNRDMVKLSKLMEKETKKSLDTVKNKREITDNTIHEIDKNAQKKDSAYWAQIRPIPLSEIEKKSIRVSDSMKYVSGVRKLRTDTIPGKQDSSATKQKSKFFQTVKNAAFGYTWRDTLGGSLRFGGLANLRNFRFNTVDGFVYGVDFGLSKNWKGQMINITPVFRWSFARERLNWHVNSFYRFKGEKQPQVYIRTGQESVDFNRGSGINIFLNTDLTLLFRRNNMKLYESGYFTMGFRMDPAMGINLDIAATYEDRRMLENNTDFSLFKSTREYTPNTPVNPYLAPDAYPLYAIRDMRHADLVARITVTPFQKYRVVKDRKIPAGSDWPTFSLTWMHGINEFREMTNPLRHFDMLRFEVSRREDLGAFSEMRWRFKTGGFLNKRYVTFYDFYHLNAQPLPFLLNDYHDAFMLPAFYSQSTPEFFVQAHAKYTTPFLFLKYLPFLSNTLMRENLSVSYLVSRHHRNYTEIGYSISEIFFVAELGVYAGFEDIRYRSAGVSLILKLN